MGSGECGAILVRSSSSEREDGAEEVRHKAGRARCVAPRSPELLVARLRVEAHAAAPAPVIHVFRVAGSLLLEARHLHHVEEDGPDEVGRLGPDAAETPPETGVAVAVRLGVDGVVAEPLRALARL